MLYGLSFSFLFALVILLIMLVFFKQKDLFFRFELAKHYLKNITNSVAILWLLNLKKNQVSIFGEAIKQHPILHKTSLSFKNFIIHPFDIALIKKNIEKCKYSTNENNFSWQFRAKKNYQKSWNYYLEKVQVLKRDQNGKSLILSGSIFEITNIKDEYKNAQLMANAINCVDDNVLVIDDKFATLEINSSFTKTTGYNLENLKGWQYLFFSQEQELIDNIKNSLVLKDFWQGVISLKTKQVDSFRVFLSIKKIYEKNKAKVIYVCVFNLKNKEIGHSLVDQSYKSYDYLTNLLNRISFFKAHDLFIKNKLIHALLVIEISNFSQIKDLFDYNIDDILLLKISNILKKIVAPSKYIYRLNEHNFALLIKGENTKEVSQTIAKRIIKAVEKPFFIDNLEIFILLKIGISLFPKHATLAPQLLKQAQKSINLLENNKSNFKFFSQGKTKISSFSYQEIGELLKNAMENNFFVLHFQPQFNIQTGKILGFEALVRLKPPGEKIIYPNDFIVFAEKNGYITQIGLIILEKSLLALEKLNQETNYTGSMSINISAKQLDNNLFISKITYLIANLEVKPSQIVLELTESSVMIDAKKSIESMLLIKSLGVKIAIDDFGTGYSSLSYLKRLPLNLVKIDRSFVCDLDKKEKGKQIVNVIIMIAHQLNLDIVAEGVENFAQIQILSEMKCYKAQGFLLSKPIEETEALKLLRQDFKSEYCLDSNLIHIL